MISSTRALALATAFLSASAAVPAAPFPLATGQYTGLPVFKPKNRGAPIIRTGGGTRGPAGAGPELYALAPEQMGFTASAQPVLYWYISKPVRATIEIAVADKRSVLLKTEIEGGAAAGIQSVNLAAHGVQLRPATQYRWSVSVVNDPAQRSGDLFASGGIEYSPPSEALEARLAEAGDDQARARIYAEEGLWYDALAAIGHWAREAPGDGTAVRARAGLLKQVGLPGFGDDGK